MNAIKRILGIVWIVLGVVAVYYLLVNQAIDMWKVGGEKLVPAIIYTFVLCPIIAGTMVTFGIYSLKGEYDSQD
jgi:ABC-type sulfate transport system permease subunit